MRGAASWWRAWAIIVLTVPAACEPRRLPIDDRVLRVAADDSVNWLSYGRTYEEQRHSPLRQINQATVSRLGLAWSLDLNTTRGLEATPLVHNGVLYTTSAWSVVHAVAATTGRLLWTYDPRVPKEHAKFACCDVVNRGAALYRGRLYSGTLDGRLIALDAATGALVWEVQTTPKGSAYTITGAPRIAAGRVIIGNGGAEFGVRGYVSAYDWESGALAWRTYTVPGDPNKPFESEALRRAAATWSGEWWKAGGGGTAWDAIVYDPELSLVYVGTGNGSPWYRRLRSNDQGDNLYLASILALRADNGELVWHYQTVPGDNWDYTATQPLMLADLTIEGRTRRVIMQAPKNGFFYVLDRQSGELISAQPFAKITWATGLDSSGRPIESTAARQLADATLVWPGPWGAHNWYPMSYNPETKLVYFPVRDASFLHVVDQSWSYNPRLLNVGGQTRYSGPAMVEWLRQPASGRLIAWDPVAQREVWRVELPTVTSGGTLSTAGNLVFQGRADGKLLAYNASDGQTLWQFDTGVGIIAPPITYLVNGRQYIALLTGWGGPEPLYNGSTATGGIPGPGRLLAFALDATAIPPGAKAALPPVPEPAFRVRASAAEVAEGGLLFGTFCIRCHGIAAISGSGVPDLRYSSTGTHEQFEQIVRGGLRSALGMPAFAEDLSPAQVRMIQAYVLHRARESGQSRQ